MTQPRSKFAFATAPGRWLMFGLGWVCVSLGIIGILTPLMPGTVFLILAAWLFSRSSPRFEAWLLAHPKLGPAVLKWRENGVIPRWVQLFATASMTVSFGLMVYIKVPLVGLIPAGTVMLACAIYLLTRPVA